MMMEAVRGGREAGMSLRRGSADVLLAVIGSCLGLSLGRPGGLAALRWVGTSLRHAFTLASLTVATSAYAVAQFEVPRPNGGTENPQ